jgi:hypothetical protein
MMVATAATTRSLTTTIAATRGKAWKNHGLRQQWKRPLWAVRRGGGGSGGDDGGSTKENTSPLRKGCRVSSFTTTTTDNQANDGVPRLLDRYPVTGCATIGGRPYMEDEALIQSDMVAVCGAIRSVASLVTSPPLAFGFLIFFSPSFAW